MLELQVYSTMLVLAFIQKGMSYFQEKSPAGRW